MSSQTRKTVRNTINKAVYDPSNIASQTYNQYTGAQKNMEMGHRFIPISLGATFTTDASTVRVIPAGCTLAIYNPTGAALSARASKAAAPALLAIGVTDAASGDVGVALAPNSYTFIATWDSNKIITSAGAITYIVADDTAVSNQAQG